MKKAPDGEPYRMLISKQRLHEILGHYVLKSHGVLGHPPATVELMTIATQSGKVEQIRVEVTVVQPDD